MNAIDMTDPAVVEGAAMNGTELGNSVSLWGEDTTATTAHPDIGMKRIATGGTANGGRWVLVGITPRGRDICRTGRVAALVRAGIPADVASIAASMPYGAELAVAALASDLVAVARIATRPTGRASWERIVGTPIPDGMSFPRALAAWDIAENL